MIPNERLILQTDTSLEHYEVVERTYEGRPARVLFSGSRRAAQSGIGLDDNPDLLFDYNQRILELANAIYPKRILALGGGVFTLPMALSAALPDCVVDVVELDAGLLPIAEQHFGFVASDRLKVHFGDGREYVAATAIKYDLIVIDVFSELSIPKQFLTREFVIQLQRALTPHGCIALNIIASYQGRNADLIKSQVAAYSSLFAALDIFPAAYGLTSWLPQNLILVAQSRGMSDLKQYIRYAPIDPVEATNEDIRYDDTSVR